MSSKMKLTDPVIASKEFLPAVSISLAVLAGLAIYATGLVLYRLILHPLAKFPGPKLAAATGWYETYFQLFKGPQGGQFLFEVDRMHRQYGPIVRITPDELHVSDPEFYETIYSSGQNIDKASWMQYMFGSPGTLFSATDSEVHRLRRGSLNPFFSKQKVLQQEKTIHREVEKMCSRLDEEFCGTGNVLCADYLFASVSCDIVAHYAFGQSYNMLDAPKFMSPFIYSIDSFKKAGLVNVQFQWLPKLVSRLPESWLEVMMPQAKPSIDFKRAIRAQILEIQSEREKGYTREQGTIFTEILNTKLPPSELKIDRLTDEAGGVVAAALETTKRALCVTLFYLVANPNFLDELRQEIKTVMPKATSPLPSIGELEKLPYLTSVTQEGLRLSYGTVGRSPRVHKTKALRYGKYTIPPGTPISASTYTIHHNEAVFPESFAFNPSRWLGNPTGPDGKKLLGRYLVSFNKGTRYCLGMQLAYAIIHLILAALVTRYDFELYDTAERDVVCTCDLTTAGVWEGSQGIRLLVKPREAAE